MAKWQRQSALIAALVVVKFDNFDFQPGVGGKAGPDTPPPTAGVRQTSGRPHRTASPIRGTGMRF